MIQTNDIPKLELATISTFEDATGVLTIRDPEDAARRLQGFVNQDSDFTKSLRCGHVSNLIDIKLCTDSLIKIGLYYRRYRAVFISFYSNNISKFKI